MDANLYTINPLYNDLYIPNHDFGLKAIHSTLRKVLAPDYYFSGEVHDFWEMCCVLKGKLTVVEDEAVYELHSGDAIFHKPMEFHNLKVEGNENAEIIVVSFSYIGNELNSLGAGVLILPIHYTQMLVDAVDEIADAYNYDYTKDQLLKKSPDLNNVTERLALLKFEIFLLSLLTTLTPKNQQKYTSTAQHYKKITNILQEHIFERLTVDEIADLCHIGKSNLKKVFKSYTGYGVMQYFNKMKIIKAINLLKQGKNITETSDMLHFSSPSYFSNAFKKETGMFPSEYKKRILDKNHT